MEYFQTKFPLFHLSESEVSFCSFHQEELGFSYLQISRAMAHHRIPGKRPQDAEQKKRTETQLLLTFLEPIRLTKFQCEMIS